MNSSLRFFEYHNQKVLLQFGDNEGLLFDVYSDSGETYLVSWDIDKGWYCNCPGCMTGGHLCKHILACEEFIKFLSMALLDECEVFKGNNDGEACVSD